MSITIAKDPIDGFREGCVSKNDTQRTTHDEVHVTKANTSQFVFR